MSGEFGLSSKLIEVTQGVCGAGSRVNVRGNLVVGERKFLSVVWTGDYLVVWGGYYGGYLNPGLRWDAADDEWRQLSDINAPVARAHHTAVWTGDRMIVWGGTAGSGVAIWSPVTVPVITGPLSLCTGETATLEAPEGYDTYLWSPDGQTTRQIDISPSQSTHYRVDTTAGSLVASADHNVIVGVDMDGNGIANGVDLELLVDHLFGGSSADCPDVNGDGIHDAADLSAWIDAAVQSPHLKAPRAQWTLVSDPGCEFVGSTIGPDTSFTPPRISRDVQ